MAKASDESNGINKSYVSIGMSFSLRGAGVLLVLEWLIVRLEWIRSENAHRAITKNIDDVKQDVRMLIKHLLERKPSGSDA